jgi:hypothetical protein
MYGKKSKSSKEDSLNTYVPLVEWSQDLRHTISTYSQKRSVFDPCSLKVYEFLHYMRYPPRKLRVFLFNYLAC